MANIKISELPLGTFTQSSIIPFVDGGTTYKGNVSGLTLNVSGLTFSGNSNFIGNITSTGNIFCNNVLAYESLQSNDIFPADDVDLNISTRTNSGTKSINLMTGPKPGGLGYTRMTITSGGTVGIGTTNPNPFTLNQSDGKLHVKSGDSGVTGGTGGSTVVIEASTTNYLSMYSPDANVSGIVFGSNSDAFGSFIRWGHDQGKLQIATANIDDYIEFGAGPNLFNTYITTSGFGINTLPSQSLHVSGNTLLQGNLTATTISATTYLNLPYNGTVGGSGSSNYVTKWVNGVDITDSLIYDDGSFVGIGASTSTNNEVFSVQMGGPVAFNNVTIYDRSNSLAIGFDDYSTWGTSGTEIAIGGGANLLSSTGQYNVSIGYSSLRDNDTGSQNTSVGYSSLRMNTSGNRNTSIGMSSLNFNETGNYNTSIGYVALGTNVHGSNNVAIGVSAGYASVGNNNTFIGLGSGQNYSGNSSIFIGNNVEDSQNLSTDNRFYLGKGIDDILLYGKLDDKQLGVGVMPTSTLHISGNNNVFRVQGLSATTTTTTSYLSIDSSGEVYKTIEPMEYVALLTQSSTTAPTDIVIKNTLRDIYGSPIVYYWNYVGVGVYDFISAGGNPVLTLNKTTITTGGAVCTVSNLTVNGFRLTVHNLFVNPVAAANGLLNNSTIEIRVYP